MKNEHRTNEYVQKRSKVHLFDVLKITNYLVQTIFLHISYIFVKIHKVVIFRNVVTAVHYFISFCI